MKIALTGATGNMGQATLEQVLKIKEVEKIKLLVLPDDKRIKKLLKKHKTQRQKIEVIFGNIAEKQICEKLVQDVDYVINLAAVIPPHSDKFPQKAIECNEIGVDVLVSAIEKLAKQPKFIHISTVALYGNRNSKHIWGRVGDPLLVSPFDIYSATKLRGEFRVLEGNLQNFVVLRQTAMLHHNMISDNISDGLMFHTCFNAPLEWVSAHDSGVLIANILRADISKKIGDNFWKHVFNIGGGLENCITGYDTLDQGFKLIGGSTKNFFEPNFNATRNFHGVWFYDSQKLNDMFDYQSQSTTQVWQEIKQKNSYMNLGKIVPKKLIKSMVIKRLFKSPNAPKYWLKHKDDAKMFAYFGGQEKYNNIPKDWKDFPLLIENRDENSKKIDYKQLKDRQKANLVDFGIDIEKDKFSVKELETYAKMHGGRLLSKKVDSLYEKLTWQTADGETFEASANTVVKAGHWYNRTYKENVWDFDRLSKNDKIFAQIWYDSHAKNEDKLYSLDKNFKARIKNI